jgi:anti-sigma factor RsiW
MSAARWLFWRQRRADSPPGDLACRELVELVTAYLEEELGARDRVRFETHLAACEHCGVHVEQMRLTLRVVGDLDPEELDPEVERRLLGAFRDWKAGG